MVYTTVTAKIRTDDRPHSAIYYGITDPATAIKRWEAEFPHLAAQAEAVTTKTNID